MKTYKACYSQLTAAAVACMLAITCSANACPKKAHASASENKPAQEDDFNRENHNSLLPASFYNSNHEIEG